MDIYLMISLNLLLMAAVVAIWFYTSWSVCGAATVISGLGFLSVGSMMSYLFFGGAAILLFLGYAVQPDVVGLVEVFKG